MVHIISLIRVLRKVLEQFIEKKTLKKDLKNKIKVCLNTYLTISASLYVNSSNFPLGTLIG